MARGRFRGLRKRKEVLAMKVEMYRRQKFWDKVRELLGLRQKRVSVIWEVQHREPGWIGRVRER